MEIKTYSNWKDEGDNIFKNGTFDLKPNTVTYLVGCNGSGKTTLVEMIKQSLKDKTNKFVEMNKVLNPLHRIFSSDKEENDKIIMEFDKDSEFIYGNFEEASMMRSFSRMCQSTGEYLCYRFIQGFNTLSSFFKNNKVQEIAILFDDLDVGTSIDVLSEFKLVIDRLASDLKERNIIYYFVVTANAYELVKGQECICVNDLKSGYRTFNDYEEYRKMVLKSRKAKEKREARREAKIKKQEEKKNG